MTPFDQALSHVLDVLSRADARLVGRASHDSLERFIEVTRQYPPAPAGQKTGRETPQPKQTAIAPASSEQSVTALSASAPPAPSPAPISPVERPATAAAPAVEAPRRKLGLAEQLRAAMASGTKPTFQEPPPKAQTAPPAPERTPEILEPISHPAPEITTAASSPAPVELPLPTKPAIPSHLPPEAQLEHLNESIMAGAYDPRTIVLGEGSARSELIFIGISPGQPEITANSPIAGEEGELFDKIVATMKLRKADLYITNILKSPATGETPSAEEIRAELPTLLSEIEIIRPKCIVALGGAALSALVGKSDSIHDLRGEWHSFRGIPVMATYHPAHLCENPGKQVRRMFWEDMLQVLELLAKPITPRQREFFK